MGRKRIDEVGNVYGRLSVVEYVGKSTGGNSIYLCECECGCQKNVTGNNLRKGNTESCGCLHKEFIEKTFTKHGGRRTRLYSIWCNMKKRCYYDGNINYADYGGRGVTVCEEWHNDFVAFRDWAMNNGYHDNLSIDRIDVNGNYEPSNCKWATTKEQSRNKRSNHYITFNGVTLALAEWAERVGMDSHALGNRLRTGWSVEMALTTPVKQYKKRA